MTKRNEVWRDIAGFENYAQVSNYGRVRSLPRTDARGARQRGRIRKLRSLPTGYVVIDLCKDGNRKTLYVHRLVLAAFVRPPKPGEQAAHSGAKHDNRVTSLRWVTRAENLRDRFRLGEVVHGERCYNAKLDRTKIAEMFRLRHSEGLSNSAIAARMKVSPANVSMILARKRWAHISL